MRVLTLNLRHNTDRWAERLPLVVDVIKETNPDLIGFQEVWMADRQAHTILGQLPDPDLYTVYATPKQGSFGHEGIAIASRYPALRHDTLDLPGGERVAQRIIIELGSTQLCFANTHLHHKQGDDAIREEQIAAVLDWIADGSYPAILTGDMNAVPESSPIVLAYKTYGSAYKTIHGEEPGITFPSPLSDYFTDHETGRTLDYIFYSADTLKPVSAAVVANRAHPDDDRLYPTDHYGVLATFELQGA